jgi:hypothetical protein
MRNCDTCGRETPFVTCNDCAWKIAGAVKAALSLPASRRPETQEPGKAGAFEETPENVEALARVIVDMPIYPAADAAKALLAWARRKVGGA